MEKITIGLDPGQTGGIAVLNETTTVELKPMPVVDKVLDLNALIGILKKYKDNTFETFVYLEKVGSMPGQGVSSTFKFGRTYGMIEAIVVALGFPYELVSPQRWTKEIHKGIEPIKNAKGKKDTKKTSLVASSRLFPGETFLATERSRKKHDGMVDACLIAEYGRRCRIGN